MTDASRFYRGQVKLIERRMYRVMQQWMCPIEDCPGEMKSETGYWADQNQTDEYRHTCDKCGFEAVLKGVLYPRTTSKFEDEQHATN